MIEPTTYEIVIKGRACAKLLRPLLDDFTFDHASEGVTRLIGEIRDAAHLNGVVAHLTSVNADLISIAPRNPSGAASLPTSLIPNQHEWSTNS